MSNEGEEKQEEKITYEIKPEYQKSRSLLSKILIFLAIIFIIAIASYGIVKLVPKAVSSLSSIGVSLSSVFKPAEKITVTSSPVAIQSGQPFTLSWTHVSKSDTNGTYSLAYACANSITVKIQNQTIPCEKSYLLGKDTSVTLTAISSKFTTTELPLSLLFSKANETTIAVKGDVVLPITNNAIKNTEGQATTTTSQAPTFVKNTSGPADLVVNLIATGVLNNSNQFITGRTAQVGEKVGIRFEIVNRGSKNTGTWNWGATLPVPPPQNIYSGWNQVSLAPGDGIEFTLGYQRTNPEQNQIIIVVDPSKVVIQNNRENDAQVVRIPAVGGNSGQVIQSYPSYPTYGNNPDLSVQVLAFGTLDSSGTTLTPQTQVYAGQRVGVRFEVTNIGTVNTIPWNFRATISGVVSSSYVSSLEPALAPGQHTTFIVGFDIPNNYSNQSYNSYGNYNNQYPYSNQNAMISITADPFLNTPDTRRDNNNASVIIPISYNSGYNSNYIYYGQNNGYNNYNTQNGYIYYNGAY